MHATLLFLLLALSLQASAADWFSVAKDKLRVVEIDRASVMDSDAGTKVAWGRIVLSDTQAEKAGFKQIRALNRYDCRNRSFLLVKRAYFSADEVLLREENLSATTATPVRPGSVDERFFNAVCPPPPKPKTINLHDIAREAERAAAATRSQ